jgi:hypothetical protein
MCVRVYYIKNMCVRVYYIKNMCVHNIDMFYNTYYIYTISADKF